MVQRHTNSTSRSMGISSRGRRMVKDMHDLFATLIVSLDLKDHRQFFKSYPLSFTTDEACFNLSALKFAQSNRAPDPKNPRRIVTTTTTKTFLMSREVAKATCQEFVDARLIFNAAEPQAYEFRERGIWKCTPKGLAVLQRFVALNGISSADVVRILSAPEHQAVPVSLAYVERQPETDQLYLNRHSVASLWARFAGSHPNVPAPTTTEPSGDGRETPVGNNGSTGALVQRPSTSNSHTSLHLPPEGPLGVVVRKFVVRSKGDEEVHEHCTPALAVLDWLLERSTVAFRVEAAEVAAQFVRWGFLALAQEKGKWTRETALITTYSETDGEGKVVEGEFRGTDRAVYRVTDEGARVAGWHTATIDEGDDDDDEHGFVALSSAAPSLRERTVRQSYSPYQYGQPSKNLFNGTAAPQPDASLSAKESSSLKLQHILADAALRALFKEFLRGCFCGENLAFVLEVQEFRKRFSTSSSAAAAPAARYVRERGGEMEYHTQELIERAFWIYNKYLAPMSPSEVNVEHVVRSDVTSYVRANLAEAAALARLRHERRETYQAGPTMTASQLQTMLVLFERVQAHTYSLMATDSVPKFLKTEACVSLLSGGSHPSLHSALEHRSPSVKLGARSAA